MALNVCRFIQQILQGCGFSSRIHGGHENVQVARLQMPQAQARPAQLQVASLRHGELQDSQDQAAAAESGGDTFQ